MITAFISTLLIFLACFAPRSLSKQWRHHIHTHKNAIFIIFHPFLVLSHFFIQTQANSGSIVSLLVDEGVRGNFIIFFKTPTCTLTLIQIEKNYITGNGIEMNFDANVEWERSIKLFLIITFLECAPRSSCVARNKVADYFWMNTF